MNKNDREFIVQKIRTQYTEKKHTELDELKALDKKVKLPAKAASYIFGSASAIIMGSGMSLVMTDIGEMLGVASPMTLGVIVGVVGLIMALATFPLYNGILSGRRRKYADRIISLSDKIVNNQA